MSSSRLIVRKRLSSLGHTSLKLHGHGSSTARSWIVRLNAKLENIFFFTLECSNLIDESHMEKKFHYDGNCHFN